MLIKLPVQLVQVGYFPYDIYKYTLKGNLKLIFFLSRKREIKNLNIVFG